MSKRKSKQTRARNRGRAQGQGSAPARSWANNSEGAGEGWSGKRKAWFGAYVAASLLLTAVAVIFAVHVGPDDFVIGASVASPVFFGVLGLVIFGIQPEDNEPASIVWPSL